MKVGDLVKFSKEHINTPGHDYVKDWIGVVVENRVGPGDQDSKLSAEEQNFHRGPDELWISWTLPWNATKISHYDEIWWNGLDYEPFEVVNECK